MGLSKDPKKREKQLQNIRNPKTKEQRQKWGKLGAEKARQNRQIRRTMSQIASELLVRGITKPEDIPLEMKETIKLLGGRDDDITLGEIAVVGQIRSASNGNSNAIKWLQEQEQKELAKNSKKDYSWHIPITDITSDWVEVYRNVHEAYETGRYTEFISKGGRGSIKSNFWAEIAYETIRQDPRAHVVYTRRFKSDLHDTVYNQFVKTIYRYNDSENWELKKQPLLCEYKPTGQKVYFYGCDNPQGLKSQTVPFGYVKLLIHEECDEMLGIDQMNSVQDTLLRTQGYRNVHQLDVKIFNPPKAKNNFMNEYTALKDSENKETTQTYVCHSYYYNVPKSWLGETFFKNAEWNKINRPEYYKNNYLGIPVGTGGAIFENLEERKISKEEIDSFEGEKLYGLDFGYNHPQTFIISHYDVETDAVYCLHEQFSRKCKNSTFARKINAFKNHEIICDSARPDGIAELKDWGFNVVGAVKRWENKGRSYSWEWLQQRRKIVIDKERCPHLYHELTTLEFKQLKDGTFSSEFPDLGEDCVMALIYSLNRVIISHPIYEDDFNDYLDDFEDDDEI